jgi:hypothetical protein
MAISAGRYFYKIGEGTEYDFTTAFVGLEIQSIEGLESVGAPKNIHYQEWVNTGRADVNIPKNDLGNIDVKFETTEVKIAFLISDFHNHSVDVKAVHNALKNIMLKNVIRIRSTYSNSTNEVVCLGGYEPSAVVVSRPAGSNYIQGVFTMKKLNSENI